MTLEQLIVGLVRLAGALPVLRWAFAGALIAIAVDFSDLFLMNLLDLGGLRNYQAFDKWLDLAYMATFLVVALRWNGPARSIAVALFTFRMAGFVAFEATGARGLLLAFPNVFEFWFVFIAARDHYRPHYVLTGRRVVAWLVILTAMKLGQEYALHGAQWLDDYVATEVVADFWRWLTPW